MNEIKCLDKGFVRLVDHMGDDSSIVQAARISYGAGTKAVSEDRALIRYLMRNRHTSPFEMVIFKFHMKLPIFVARQMIRHRTFSVNEYSARYSEMKDEFYIPEKEHVKKQSKGNKQGREESYDNGYDEYFINNIHVHSHERHRAYIDALKQDMARETARMILPVNIYTEWYIQGNLHNIFHFLKLRLDEHAQYEIRVYAQAVAEIVKQYVPVAYEAFEDYVLNSVNFSRVELLAISHFLPDITETDKLQGRELSEFHKKIKLIKSLGEKDGQ